MSRRVTEKETLDHYDDFIILPAVDQVIPAGFAGNITAFHYGTGYEAVNPVGLAAAESGHPGILSLTLNSEGSVSDNPQIQAQFGASCKMKDYTRFTCTFRLDFVPTADEFGWFNAFLSQWNAFGSTGLYLYNPVTYSYGQFLGKDWFIAGSSDTNPATYNESVVLNSSDREAQMVAWHNYDVRIDYEQGVVRHFLDGKLIMTEFPNAAVWDRSFAPNVGGGEYTQENAKFLIDEIGWATRKVDIDGDEIVTERETTLRPGTTRRDNLG